ncbi:LarC family nickel insertion protein [Halanaerobium sp. Z-7514]|uniref:LarC family nickel insertion protein n=1 Tax=Halanaerobium polyolivorans TaxID=2886943 RepID=A0AAW4X1U5_9FIRM|nr:LarC family nickel insertion protein [Halanaerobium polyolivorans]MCC3145772.1 LarC family nickel insertion protein [Halanaerobium polyolivorans]
MPTKEMLYFDTNSGISGDMTIAALLDLGLNKNKFFNELQKLNINGYKLEVSTVKKNGIKATDFKVILKNSNLPDENKSCAQKKEPLLRNLNDINNLIDKSKLKEEVKKLSKEIFVKIAVTESKVHDKKINEIFFHEVGAVDSIIDIVGAAILIEMISPDKIYSSPIPLGNGFRNSKHGILPIPSPATIEILKETSVYSMNIKSELVTPTGAAIIKTIAEKFIPLPESEITQIGYGAGKRQLPTTKTLRIYKAKIK